MFDILALYEEGTEEYEELMYRITVSQHYQQLAIDKIKGIIAEPMPPSWYQRRDCETDFDQRVVCDKKPYFMTYIYEKERKEYNEFEKNANAKSYRRFKLSLKEVLLLNQEDLTQKHIDHINSYLTHKPSLSNNCLMNRLCRYMESELGEVVEEVHNKTFDTKVLKTKTHIDKQARESIEELYKEYKVRVSDFMQMSRITKIDKQDANTYRSLFIQEFRNRAREICSNPKVLCNIVVDLCYKGNTNKQFAWDVCRVQLIENLISNKEVEGC